MRSDVGEREREWEREGERKFKRERENHSFHFPVRHMKTVYSLEHQN